MKFLFSTLLYCITICLAFAQESAKETIILDSAIVELNRLYRMGTDSSKLELKKLSVKLAATDDQVLNIVGYSALRLAGEAKDSDSLKQAIIERYPNGILSREQRYEILLNDKHSTNAQFQKSCNSFLAAFPKEHFATIENGDKYGFSATSFYDVMALGLTKKFIERKDYLNALLYIQKTEHPSNIISNFTETAKLMLDSNKVEIAYQLITKVNDTLEVLLQENPSTIKNISIQEVNYVYLRTLIGYDKIEESNLLSERLYEKGDKNLLVIKTLVNYQQLKNNNEKALEILEGHLVNNGVNFDDISKEQLKLLFYKVHTPKESFTTYLDHLKQKYKKRLFDKYSSELIKDKAPDFNLYNLSNELIQLSDLKGKIVILDFWATWCGPCLKSFPGMQQVVNDYKHDDEVVFLFINTSQKEQNYKKLVADLMQDNRYSFHVLFDEMSDWNKRTATTYNVDVLPTKIFIDKSGYIRFRSEGSSSKINTIHDEISIKIEVLRSL